MTDKLCRNCESFRNGKCIERKEDVKEESSCSFHKLRDVSQELKDSYYTIIDILKKYLDMEERYYPIVALWIVGTYGHDEFETYPYLFLNASKGSGKTRLLRLISVLSKNGRVIGSLTEASLFRGAKGRTFCIDEFEQIGGEDKKNLRELLNSGYKKGLIIERWNKRKSPEGEIWVPEAHDVYTNIAMANIWGMESVLGDRCITLTLEKSSVRNVTKLIENFDKDFAIQKIKALLNEIKDNFCDSILEKNMSQYWNDYILGVSNSNLVEQTIVFFKKVDETGIEGRNLELLLPLYFIANLIDEETLNKILDISKEIVKEREEEDYFENKDKVLMRFLSEKIKQESLEYFDKISTTKIANQFKEYLGDENEWINAKWLGKALKRLKILKNRKRESGGMQVWLNTDKLKSVVM